MRLRNRLSLMVTATIISLSACVVACGDDESESNVADTSADTQIGDTSAPPTDTGAEPDATSAPDTLMADAIEDADPTDAAGDATGDTTELDCFEFSLDPDIPLVLDGTFDASSEFWRRPHDEEPVCPATALTPETAASVPYVVYAFCNKDTVEHTFMFEMLSVDGPSGETPLDDPYLFLYEGIGIPTDALQCLEVNDDMVDAMTSDSEILDVVVPPGGAITMVGTTYTYEAATSTGQGYYYLIATVTDL